MRRLRARRAEVIVQRVFAAWSIAIPTTFASTFVEEDGYWHAYDQRGSVSLTSVLVTDDAGPISSEAIVRQIPPLTGGTPVDELPDGLVGWCVEADAPAPAKASRMISGMLATSGRILLVTITSDDAEWRRQTWLSIRTHAVEFPEAPRDPVELIH